MGGEIFKIYKLDVYPYSFFSNPIASYTIFGALGWAKRLLYGENGLKEFLEKYKEETSFLLSDLMPVDNEGNLYFPKPLLEPKRENKNLDTTELKKFKKIKYIPEDIFKEILEGKIKNDFQLFEKWKESKKEKSNIFEEFLIPHASINRFSYESNYFNENVFVADRFFLLVAVKNEDVLNELKALFKLIEDIGLGGNRSIGFGRVKFGDFEEIDYLNDYFNNFKNSKRFITLSPLIPVQNTYNLENSYYDYFTFRGAIDNNYLRNIGRIWKDKVLYLTTGSVLELKENNGKILGQFKEVSKINNTPVYQYGYAFPLYI